MSDHSSLTPSAAELQSVHFNLLDHVARHLAELLPQHLTMIAAPEQLILTSASTGPARTVATHSVSTPERLDLDNIRVVAHHILADAQDLVIEHLREPWPTTPDGRPLYASTDLSGHSVKLGFRTSLSSKERVVQLPDFVLPDASGIVRSAG
jgi:hypothetical protein